MKVEVGKEYNNGYLPSSGRYASRYVESISKDGLYVRYRSFISGGDVTKTYSRTRYMKREKFEEWAKYEVGK